MLEALTENIEMKEIMCKTNNFNRTSIHLELSNEEAGVVLGSDGKKLANIMSKFNVTIKLHGDKWRDRTAILKGSPSNTNRARDSIVGMLTALGHR